MSSTAKRHHLFNFLRATAMLIAAELAFKKIGHCRIYL